VRDDYVRRDYTSSVELHESYWDWRDAFPAEPYWAHFQPTDVHAYASPPRSCPSPARSSAHTGGVSSLPSGQGRIEVIDGRWGASLRIGPQPDAPELRRPWPVLLYDVWADPFALHPLNEQRP